MVLAKNFSNRQKEYSENIKSTLHELNLYIDNLPNYRNQDLVSSLMTNIENVLDATFENNL